MPLAADLELALREFAADGPAELRDHGARIAPLATLSWEVRGNAEKPLLHLWSENLNLTRRVLAITDHSEQRLALAVESFGHSKPDRLDSCVPSLSGLRRNYPLMLLRSRLREFA